MFKKRSCYNFQIPIFIPTQVLIFHKRGILSERPKDFCHIFIDICFYLILERCIFSKVERFQLLNNECNKLWDKFLTEISSGLSSNFDWKFMLVEVIVYTNKWSNGKFVCSYKLRNHSFESSSSTLLSIHLAHLFR